MEYQGSLLHLTKRRFSIRTVDSEGGGVYWRVVSFHAFGIDRVPDRSEYSTVRADVRGVRVVVVFASLFGRTR